MRSYYKVFFRDDMTSCDWSNLNGQFPAVKAVRMIQRKTGGALVGGGMVGGLATLLNCVGFNQPGNSGYYWGVIRPDNTFQGVGYSPLQMASLFFDIVDYKNHPIN